MTEVRNVRFRRKADIGKAAIAVGTLPAFSYFGQ
jgi:hypothetical protein